MSNFIPTIGFLFLLAVAACIPEDEAFTTDRNARLIFSRDSVQFDTVFTTVGSISQWLQVYNPNANAIDIQKLTLGKAENSPFQITVNGEDGAYFDNIRLRGGDSLLILVKVRINPQDTNVPFLVRDSIVLQANGIVQDIKLEAWGQDAHFLSGEVILRDTTFVDNRPYVILDSLKVASSTTLTLAPGTQLYFNNQAIMLIEGTLRAEGTSADQIQLQYIRKDNGYDKSFGQWIGVLFGPKSKDNHINFTTIRNAIVGIGINSFDNDTIPDVTISNTIIQNMANYGVLAIEADLDISNTLISNCISGSIYGKGRAYYRLRHCTLVNQEDGLTREDGQPLLYFDQNFNSLDGLEQKFSLKVINCIVWGNLSNELLFEPIELSRPVNLTLTNTIIKSSDTTPFLVERNLYNQVPNFSDAPSNYSLNVNSPAIDAGLRLDIEEDLKGKPRDSKPDIGAYEYSEDN